MIDRLLEGLGIVGVGITGVFVGLLVILTAVTVLGRLFGKKPQVKTEKKAAPPAGGATAADAGARATGA